LKETFFLLSLFVFCALSLAGVVVLAQWPPSQLRCHSWVACPEGWVGFRTRAPIYAAKQREIGSGHNFSYLVLSSVIFYSFLSCLVLSCAVDSRLLLSPFVLCLVAMHCVVLPCIVLCCPPFVSVRLPSLALSCLALSVIVCLFDLAGFHSCSRSCSCFVVLSLFMSFLCDMNNDKTNNKNKTSASLKKV
jgi:hypothetical protein